MTRQQFRRRVAEEARKREGIRESGGRNRGPEIDQWVKAAGGKEGDSWCHALVYDVHAVVAAEAGIPNPVPRTCGVHKGYERSSKYHVAHPVPGAVYYHDSGKGKGHVGIDVDLYGTHLSGTEGNTNERGEREGDRVARKTRRYDYVNLGWVDYALALPDDEEAVS